MNVKIKIFLVIFVPVLISISPHTNCYAQSIEVQKAAVAKILSKSEGVRKNGTGFVIRIESEKIYVITAAHVVAGDNNPKVVFYKTRNISFPAEVIRLEGTYEKGLALLLVRGTSNLARKLIQPILNSRDTPKVGDNITVIGYPRFLDTLSIIKGNIVSKRGRNLIFTGAIDDGISGSPLIKGGYVIGLVTEVATPYSFATPAISIKLFVEGCGLKLPKVFVRAPTGTKDKIWKIVDKRLIDALNQHDVRLEQCGVVYLSQVRAGGRYGVIFWPALDPYGRFIDNDIMGCTLVNGGPNPFKVISGMWDATRGGIEEEIGRSYVVRDRNEGVKLSQLGSKIISLSGSFAMKVSSGSISDAVDYATEFSRLFSFRSAVLSTAVSDFLIRTAEDWGPSGLKHFRTDKEGNSAKIILSCKVGGKRRPIILTASKIGHSEDRWVVKSVDYRRLHSN